MINHNRDNVRIHKTVELIGDGEIIGVGYEIRAYSIVEMDSGSLTIGHRAVIGYHNVIQCSGNMSIGDGTLIGPHCTLLASSHPITNTELINTPLNRGFLKIGNNVWIGANCTIAYNVTIGDNAVIGANSFVNQDVPTNAIYAGSPAKYIRDRQ